MGIYRSATESREVVISKNIRITGTGALTVNVFQLTNSVRVLDQVAEIVSITTLTNATHIYADLYDGTNTVLLTADGAELSGLPVGTLFSKDKVASDPFSVSDASQCRVNENIMNKDVGLPFTVTQKSATNTYIRLHLTTTDNPVDFTINLHFAYEPVDGGSLTLLV